MVLGIDATNIRNGGGFTHLKEIITHLNKEKCGFSKVVIWSSEKTLNEMPDYEWLLKISNKWLNHSFVISFFYQSLLMSFDIKRQKCEILFVPGGTFLGNFKNIISMSQNMLPFEKNEYLRFPKWSSRLKFRLLRVTQSYTFKKSKGVIFLTNYAKNVIVDSIKIDPKKSIVIPHGIKTAFINQPKIQRSIQVYNSITPFRFLYVSIITEYKHQWNVSEAIIRLKKEGYPVTLELVGGFTPNALQKLNKVLLKDKDNIINYRGLIPYEDLTRIYKDADGFIFASTCENMPIILIEAMTAGLPIASSEKQPMTEVLGDDAFYFNANDVESIYNCLREFLLKPLEREVKSKKAFNKAMEYTWQDCSDSTFKYLFKESQKYGN